ncbi:Bcr/CflA family drug resistance efflux transporter, partial [Pseudomonas syringae pv. tagetis]
ILCAKTPPRLRRKPAPAFWLSRTGSLYLAAALFSHSISGLRTQALWPLLVQQLICVESLGCIIHNASACAMRGHWALARRASALL